MKITIIIIIGLFLFCGMYFVTQTHTRGAEINGKECSALHIWLPGYNTEYGEDKFDWQVFHRIGPWEPDNPE